MREHDFSSPTLRASLMGLGAGGAFTTGHLLDEHCRAALATEDVGRMLSPAEAAALLERFERASARKPPAPSISRQSRQARRAETG